MLQNDLYKKIKEQVSNVLFEKDEAADITRVSVNKVNKEVKIKLNSDKSFSVTFNKISDITNNSLKWITALKKAVKKQLRKKSHKAFYIASINDEDATLAHVKGLEHLKIRSIYPLLHSFSFYATNDEVHLFTMKNNYKIVCQKNHFYSVDPNEQEDQSQVNVTPGNSTPNLPQFLQRIGASNSLARQPDFNYSESEYAKDIYIFVLDTGIFRHAELNINETLCRDFTNSETGWNDVHGHGTHVAGSIAARDVNIGVAPGVKVIAHKVLGDNGRGNLEFDIKSFNEIATFKTRNPNAKIIVNMSLGEPVPRRDIGPPFSETKTYDNAEIQISRLSKNNNITFVTSAGNSTHDASVTTPSRVLEAITVGAYDSTDNIIAKFSQFGPLVDIMAPGVDINSTLPPLPNSVSPNNTRTGVYSGTSMAAPIVTGAICNMLAVEAMRNPNNILTPAEIRQRLRNDAECSFNNNNNNNPPVSINPQISMNNPSTNLCWAYTPNPDPDGDPLPPLFSEAECNNNWFTSIGGQPSALNRTYPYSLFIGSYTKDGATVQNY